MEPERLKYLVFAVAALNWIETRKPYLKERSIQGLELHVSQLSKFFGEIKLKDIHIGHVREYQRVRGVNQDGLWSKTCGASIIRHEISTLKGVMERVGEWDKIKPFYEPLRLPGWKVPKVPTTEEEMLIYAIASSSPELEVAYLVSGLTQNCGAAGTELRHLQLEDITLSDRVRGFYVKPDTAKNEHRGRWVSLNDTAFVIMQKLIERGKKLGSCEAKHYLFPIRVHRGKYDPTRPASESWLRKPFIKLRAATGLAWLTPHCFRHYHITLRIEAGESPFSIAPDVGHTSTRMTMYYYHQRTEHQQHRLAAIDPRKRFGPQTVAWMENGGEPKKVRSS